MRPLIDGDVLLYELGFAAEAGWQQPGVPPFDYVADLTDNRIGNICALAGGTVPPTIYFTGKTNFRTEIAKRRKYKERPSLKPFHYRNIRAYLKGKYDWEEHEGVEADDLMAIEQTACRKLNIPTIICTRDKDLRQVEGWQYGWEIGNQPSFGPEEVVGYGRISLVVKETGAKKIKTYKVVGTGDKFFLSQCITGDAVDTIPGLTNGGPQKAFNLLDATTTYLEGYKAVLEAYRAVYGNSAEKELKEQAQLLYMVREWNEDGTPKMWEHPNV